MKRLLIMRHGKADPDRSGIDHERQLTDRGRRNSTAIGEWIAANHQVPDLVVSSSAARALETAELAAEGAGFDGHIVIENAIYEAGTGSLLEIVQSFPDSAETVLMTGHNPGVSSLAISLAGKSGWLDLPTAAIAVLEFNVEHWSDIEPGQGNLVAIQQPREL